MPPEDAQEKHVFVSYVNENSDEVDKLCAVLDAVNIPYRQNDLTDDELAAMISIISRESGKILMPTVVAQLRQDMHECAVELRKLAYTMPNGVGEHDLLQLRSR